jgi:hypothetical protein
MSDTSHAPFPPPSVNAPGLSTIRRRVGDFTSLRDAMLRPLEGEQELVNWRPGVEGDLALQIVEWWAYIADILTFYDERIANEDYLRTAQLPESVAHLVQLLGYRPRPALGSKGAVAGLLSAGARTPVTVPARLQIQSNPGPGRAPQVFEVDAPTALASPDVVIADVVPPNIPLFGGPDRLTLWLAGKVTGVKPADALLLISGGALAGQTVADFLWMRVRAVNFAKDPMGADVTALSFSFTDAQKASAGRMTGAAAGYVLLKPRQSSPLWTYSSGGTVLSTGQVQLAGLGRGIQAGSLILIDGVGASRRIRQYFDMPPEILSGLQVELADFIAAPVADQSSGPLREYFLSKSLDASFGEIDLDLAKELVAHKASPPFAPTASIARSYSESIWYANGAGPNPPTGNSPPPAIGIPSATVTFDAWTGYGTPILSTALVRWDWVSVGQIVPVLTAPDYQLSVSGALAVDPSSKNAFIPGTSSAMIEDVNGVAAQTSVTVAGDGSATVTDLDPSLTFSTPIQVFYDPIPVSRGKTVMAETLGGGDTRVSGQDFALAKSAVTYFVDAAAVSGDSYSSTVSVSVNGVKWREARSFFDAGPNDQIYVLREDDQGVTHVTFGDGDNGARLPTGVGNVVASYRFGAGGVAPARETLTTVLHPSPGLKGVRNPLPPTGGADPDPPARLKALAPGSVLTLGRVVSIDDFAVTAARAGGVTHAAASFAFDPVSQRPKATVWVSGDDGAVASATAALASAGVSMGGFAVLPAKPITARLQVNYLRDARYDDGAIQAAITLALLDPDTGLLGANVLGIGEAVYDSAISGACMSVPGVVAVTGHVFTDENTPRFMPLVYSRGGRPRFPAFQRGPRHDPGAGAYFSVPNDGAHLNLNGAAAP